MKIAFNLLNIGMGNNGGTRTLLKCVDTINKIGHQAYMLAKVDHFTWFQHQKPLREIPKDLDVIISASCHDISSTIKSNVQKKFWYIRGHEIWLMPETNLIKLYNCNNVKNLVNSIGLQKKLKTFNADSIVVYQGVDFDLWHNKNLRPKNKIRIGCLYHTKHKTKRWCDFVTLSKILGSEKYEFVGIGNSNPKENFLTDFKVNVDSNELCEIYSSCHIWFSPTESEGLHNVPLEASLCGSLVVCSNHEMNGMINDYATQETAMIYEQRNIEHAASLIQNANWSLITNMQNKIKEQIGTRTKNMLKLINILEK